MLSHCPACQSSDVETDCFVHDGAFVSSATLEDHPASPAELTRISLSACPKCGMVFNRDFDEDRMRRAYRSPSYVVKKVLPGRMSEGLALVAAKISSYVNPETAVMEIGSGDGRLAMEISSRCREMITVDPSYASISCGAQAANMRHYHDYFGPDVADDVGRVDVVIARHLLEHLTAPMDFLTLVGRVLAPGGILYLETPDFGEIMASSRYYDVFNDHVAYYSTDTLLSTAARAGFRGLEHISMFFGQHGGWFFVKDDSVPSARPPVARYDYASLDHHAAEIDALVEESEGPVAVYGAGAHGVTLWSYLSDAARTKVSDYLDADRSKEGRFIPGTNRQVRGPEATRLNEYQAIVLAAALYETEISRMLRERGYTGRIIKTARKDEGN
jgi:2-polyprenyl-3-methyl-5-hydroxy-6-metoxy-1,4-benzoquinol methylase